MSRSSDAASGDGEDAPLIETERLRMRPLELRDLDAIHGLFADPEVMRFSLTGTRDRDGSRDWLMASIDKYREHGHGFLALELLEDGQHRYVGHAGLLPQQVDGRAEIEIGYWLLRRYWGRGLATEAACALRDHARDALGCSRLVSLIVPENIASRSVAERVGMTLEKETVWKDTRVCVYSLEV